MVKISNNLNYLGNLVTRILLKNEFSLSHTKLLHEFEAKFNIKPILIQENYQHISSLNNLNMLNNLGDIVFNFRYELNKNRVTFNFNKDYIEFCIYRRLNVEIYKPVINFLTKLLDRLIFIIIGFEVDFFINDVDKFFQTTLYDKSIYPIYIANEYSVDNRINFYKASNNAKFIEKEIENYIILHLNRNTCFYGLDEFPGLLKID